jgi:SAM-dependent methyltransferase
MCNTGAHMGLFGAPQDYEVSDVIVAYDPVTLQRVPVQKQEILKVFSNNRRAASIISRIPERGGCLDSVAVDRLLIKVHWEMQRLAEEFHHGARILELLRMVIAAIRSEGSAEPLRIVDVGCGIGYAIRWLAAKGCLAEQGIELTGVDLNSTLIAEANRLARLENLSCRFYHGDAFSEQHSGNIYISTGVVHHFRGDALTEFFRRQGLEGTAAFLHYDFHPWLLAPYGSWFFHVLRMRTALARHDGVLSTVRAHSADTLLQAARKGAPMLACGIYGARIWGTPLPRVFQTLLGIRPSLMPALTSRLRYKRQRLEGLQ